jgi:hypothetical protein
VFSCEDSVLFPSRIRDMEDFPWRRLELELVLSFVVAGRTEGVDWACAGRVLTLLASWCCDMGRTSGGSWARVGLHEK